MFGWIHESIRQLVLRKYGPDVWAKIIQIANFEAGTECDATKYYKDEDTFRMVNAVGTVIGIPTEEVWEAYGGFLIQFTMETGWDDLLRSLATDLEGFLDNLDALHYFIDHVVYNGQLKGPSFRCEPHEDGTLTLHYYSKRSGLYPIVKGVVREVARRLFGTDIVMKVKERKQEQMDDNSVAEHVIFNIAVVDNSDGTKSIVSKSVISLQQAMQQQGDFALDLADFVYAFPHHVCFDSELYVEHYGIHVQRTFPFCMRKETKLTDIMELKHPDIPCSFTNLISYINGIFVFALKQQTTGVEVRVKGQMVLLEGGKYMLYLCAPQCTSVRELIERNLYLNDIPLHDATRDLILLNQSRMSQQELNKKLEETTNKLKKMASELEEEKEKTDNLLSELLPGPVADALRHGGTVEAGEFPAATIVFTDIVSFTNICSRCTPYDVVNLLNELYLRFDRLTGINKAYKVETIGDAYMVVAGVPEVCDDHAERLLNMSIGMQIESRSVIAPGYNLPIQIRAGVHTGPVVAGVVGKKMPRYCLFGDTVNLASRMESNGIPSRIHVSDSTKDLVNDSMFEFEDRGVINIKGSGDVHTYFLIRNKNFSVWELIQRERAGTQTVDGYQELHDVSLFGDVYKKKPIVTAENGQANAAPNQNHAEPEAFKQRRRQRLADSGPSKFCVIS